MKLIESIVKNTYIVFLAIIILITVSVPSIQSATEVPNIKINDDDSKENQWFTDIAVDNDNRVHVVWNDLRDEVVSVYYANSDTGGLSFNKNIKLADVEIDDFSEILKSGPVVAADGAGNIYCAYYTLINGNYDIVLLRSSDKGSTFSEMSKIPDNEDTNQVAVDILATGTDKLYAVWMDYSGDSSKILFSSSNDGGASFGTPVLVNDGTGNALYPRMARSPNGHIHIVWQDLRGGSFDVYYTVSKNGGSTFDKNKLVAGGSESIQGEPAIAVDATGAVYVSYSNAKTNESDIYFIRSADGGSTWSDSIQINDDIDNTTQKNSRVVVDSKGKVYVVWEDNRSHRGDIYFDIYTASSNDGGATFGANEKVNNDPLKNIYHLVSDHIWPDITVDGNDRGYIVWVDNRERNYDVYCANLPLGVHNDTIPPEIEHVPVAGGTAFRPIEIKAIVTDNVGVAVVKFHYRVAGKTNYTSFAMSKNGNVYTAEIPGSLVTTTGLEYYIEATDTINFATSPESNPAGAPHVIAVTSLSPPAVFTVEPGDGLVKFSWSGVDGAAGYNLYRSEFPDSGFSLVSLVSIKGTSFEDTQVKNGITYYFYITSVDSEGTESAPSETREVTPKAENGGETMDKLFLLFLVLIVVVFISVIVYAVILIKIKRNR